MKREVKFRAMLSDKYYAHPRMVSWGELLDSFDALHIFDEDFMTLMQFTGLKDVSGKPIYEGDLFEHRFGYMVFDDTPHSEMGVEYGVVVFDDGRFGVRTPGWGVRSLYDLLSRDGHLDDMPKDDLFVMKIAGNIHDNPELLD